MAIILSSNNVFFVLTECILVNIEWLSEIHIEPKQSEIMKKIEKPKFIWKFQKFINFANIDV